MRKERRKEKISFASAFLILFAFIIGGIGLAEAQLNTMTGESAFVRAANIRWKDEEKSAADIYLLGERFTVRGEDVRAARQSARLWWRSGKELAADIGETAERYGREFFGAAR